MPKVNKITEKPIELTENAAKRIISEFQKLATNGAAYDFIGVKFSVKKTGCSGFSYVVDIIKPEENTSDLLVNNRLFKSQGIDIYVANEIYQLVAGTKIDYVKQGLGHVMVFDNPNATALCGCGISFTVDAGKK